MFKKLKTHLQSDQVFIILILVLVSVGSFGLGRLSILPTNHDSDPGVARVLITPSSGIGSSIDTTPRDSPVPTVDRNETLPQPVVASRSGTKYHSLTCPGASQIKAANRIEFASPAEARAAGYTPAANCPSVY